MPAKRLSFTALAITVAISLCHTNISSASDNNTPTNLTTLANTLSSAYKSITTTSCLIRKTVTVNGRSVRWLSRVHYKTGGYVHVDNISPAKRRIVADGKDLYYHDASQLKGYSSPIPDLDPLWTISLKNVPGTPLEHLLRLQAIPEDVLPATTQSPLRRGYQAPKVYVVLSCDSSNRLASIEFFTDKTMTQRTTIYRYSKFHKVSDQCWIPTLHKATTTLPGQKPSSETKRFDNLAVNKPIPKDIFNASLFFKDIKFVSDFKETLAK